MNGTSLFGVLKGAFTEWGKDKASRLGAALAYYAIFAIGPLLVVIVSIVGLVYSEAAIKGQIGDQLSSVVGQNGASMVQSLIASASNRGSGIAAATIGVVLLVLGAIGIFGQLKDALNTIWGVGPKPGGGIMPAVMRNVMAFLMVVVMAVLLLASLVISAVVAAIGKFVPTSLPGGSLLWQLVNYAITLAIIALLFTLIFKVLPDASVPWRDAWIGGSLTAVLFTLGQIGLGIYFSLSNPGSAFGAAGSLVVLLVWIYYSAQILFFGAEFTKVYSRQRGDVVLPAKHARWASAEAEAAARSLSEKAASARGATRPESTQSPWFA